MRKRADSGKGGYAGPYVSLKHDDSMTKPEGGERQSSAVKQQGRMPSVVTLVFRLQPIRLVIPAVAIGVALVVAVWGLAASRAVAAVETMDAMNVTAASSRVGLIAAAAASAPLVLAWSGHLRGARAFTVLPLVAFAYVAFHAMLFWFSVPPCGGIGFTAAILCAHPYWILVPALVACSSAIAAVLLPRQWGGWNVVHVALGSVLIVLGLLQVMLRREHGSLPAGLLLVAIGGAAVAGTILLMRSRESNTRNGTL